MRTLHKRLRIVDKQVLEEFRKGQCIICFSDAVDACHIKSKGSGGPDLQFNLISMCRKHHSEQHQVGWFKMIALHPILLLVLKAKGWSLTEADGLKHPELNHKDTDANG